MEQRELTADETYSELISYIQENQIFKVMLVCDDSLRYLRIYKYLAEIEQASGIHIIYFSDFKPNPLYESVVRGVKWFRRHNCDAIIAIGGGSAIDVAKCIKLYSNNLYIVPSEFTPRIDSICALVILGLYAIIANVSIAAFDKFGFDLLSNIGYMYS